MFVGSPADFLWILRNPMRLPPNGPLFFEHLVVFHTVCSLLMMLGFLEGVTEQLVHAVFVFVGPL